MYSKYKKYKKYNKPEKKLSWMFVKCYKAKKKLIENGIKKSHWLKFKFYAERLFGMCQVFGMPHIVDSAQYSLIC